VTGGWRKKGQKKIKENNFNGTEPKEKGKKFLPKKY